MKALLLRDVVLTKVWERIQKIAILKQLQNHFKTKREKGVGRRSRQGRTQGGCDRPPKTYESNFFHHDLNNSENSICDIKPFCRPLFCHDSVVKFTSSLLQ